MTREELPTVEQIDWSRFDFVDLGCSNGGSLRHCAKRWGDKKGVGVDLSEIKVRKALKLGFDSVLADATTINLEKRVEFVSMMNFLEHLPDLATVEAVIAASARSARDFLFIRHPSFEGEEEGNALGYRQFWWTWDHHPTHVRLADYKRIFKKLDLQAYLIRHVDRVDTTAHPSVVPESMGRNVSKHAVVEKSSSSIQLSPPWWRRQDIFVPLKSFDPGQWEAITRPHSRDRAYGFEDVVVTGLD